MVPIKPAATVMIGRDHEGHFEVLLVRRNKQLAFAPGAWVYPGGKIEAEELEVHPELEQAARVAAIRETAEETNIHLNPESLITFRHWTTPDNNNRRFSTWFFFGAFPADRPVIIDDSEIKDFQWIRPQLALEQFKMGELSMLPPTFISLQIVRTCQSVSDASQRLDQEEVVFVAPRVKIEDKTFNLLYKGDAGYEQTNPQAIGPRHRYVIDLKQKRTHFEYRGCDDFRAVNAGDNFFN